MPTYIIGDIQGCMEPLAKLLEKVNFDPKTDALWSVGDLVNRGSDSLDVLRFLKSLGTSFKTVLGNHDLHLIAVAYGTAAPKKGDTLDNILGAPDRNQLIEWLIHQPLLLREKNTAVVHAGIPHIWSIEEARSYAREVEAALQAGDPATFLRDMYGNVPDRWSNDLAGTSRLRTITNYLTRMRVCSNDGTLHLGYKGPPEQCPQGYAAWFTHRARSSADSVDVFFGHWATLPAMTYDEKYHALDSGCVWGNALTIYHLEERRRITYPCR